ncbi:hypothetical protein NC652_017991 [Populus alba x Populus x berolinensis]|nr:hypothetical protein NC652_017991 [Populus alba x Populus x berolinensis]
MKMVVYSRQKTEKQQQAWLLMELKPDYYAIYSGKTLCRIGMGWSTHLSRSKQNLVKNRVITKSMRNMIVLCVDSWAFNCFRDLTTRPTCSCDVDGVRTGANKIYIRDTRKAFVKDKESV